MVIPTFDFFANTIPIRREADFPVQDATTITLGDGCYLFQAAVTITKRFIIPDGASVEFTSSCFPVNFLIYPGSETLFTGSPRFLFIRNMTLIGSTGFTDITTNARIFDLTLASGGRGTLFVNNCTMAIFEDLGTITDLTTVFILGIDFFIYSKGLQFNGIVQTDITSIRPFNLFTGNAVNAAIQLTGGTFDTFTINNGLQTPFTGSSFIDIDSSVVINAGEVTGVTFASSNGGTFFESGSIDQTDIKWTFKDNGEAPNSLTIGTMCLDDNATVTTINTINVYEDIAGTSTAGGNIERFTFSTSPNEITYTGLRPTKGMAFISLSATDGSSGKIFDVTLMKNGSATQGGSMPVEFDNRTKNIAFSTSISFVTGDVFKVMIRNTEGTENITVTDFQLNIIV